MSDLHALLIGVDRYEPVIGPDQLRLWDLAGAVNDTLRMAGYLRTGPFGVPFERIRTLISPGPFSEVEVPRPVELPTYANIVREIKALADKVGDGDQVLIHFSGHGARVPTVVPVKGRQGLDEAIVPLDGADPDGGVLRDVEIYRLLSELSATGAYVTVILDSCHSGGAFRSGSAGQVRDRGLGTRRGAWGPRESELGSWDELYDDVAAVERARPLGAVRHAGAESGWFPLPERCVLLAACRGPELAREQAFESVGVSGAFTHLLLQALAELGEEVPYKTLQHLVRERIRAPLLAQTPVFEGAGDLMFLGAGRRLQARVGDDAKTDHDAGCPVELGRRLARIRDFATPPGSPLAGALEVELFRLERKEDWHDPALRQPVDRQPSRIDQLLCLLVRNRSDQVLNLVVIDIRPEGEVERVHPKRDEGEFAVVDPEHDHPVFLFTWLPEGVARAESRLKVVASTEPIEPRVFEVPLDGTDSLAKQPSPAQTEPWVPGQAWAVAELSLTVVR